LIYGGAATYSSEDAEYGEQDNDREGEGVWQEDESQKYESTYMREGYGNKHDLDLEEEYGEDPLNYDNYGHRVSEIGIYERQGGHQEAVSYPKRPFFAKLDHKDREYREWRFHALKR
jgi:hypothetical protein